MACDDSLDTAVGYGYIVHILKMQLFLEGLECTSGRPFDGPPGKGSIRDDEHVTDNGLKTKGRFQGAPGVNSLNNAGQRTSHLSHSRGVCVDPAEHDRNAWKQCVGTLEQEVEGLIIRTYDDTDRPWIRVFCPQQLGCLIQIRRIRVPFGIQVFKVEEDLTVPVLLERFTDALGDVVGPGKGGVVGMDNQHLWDPIGPRPCR